MDLNGSDNIDTIKGTTFNDSLQGYKGNDFLSGLGGNDKYIFNTGDGKDIISETSGNDTIEFGFGITTDELSFTKVGNNLVISLNPDDQITIKNFFLNSVYRIENLTFYNGDILSYNDILGRVVTLGTSGNDTLKGTSGKDYINAGIGNDKISGLAGNDTYMFSAGDGKDTIYESAGNDTIFLGSDIVKEQIEFDRNGNNLVIIINRDGDTVTDQITVSNYFYQSAYQVENIIFEDDIDGLNTINKDYILSTILTEGTSGNDVLKGSFEKDTFIAGEGNDKLYGYGGNDTYKYISGDGSDIIYETAGNDTIEIVDDELNEDNLILEKSNSNLVVRFLDNPTDKITIYDHFYSKNNRIDNIKFDSGAVLDINNLKLGTSRNDNIAGNTANNLYFTGLGNDTIRDAGGNDIYYLKANKNNVNDQAGDDIYRYYSGNVTLDDTDGNDTLKLYNIASIDDDKYSRIDNNLILTLETGTITIKNWFLDSSKKIELIEFSDGSRDLTSINSLFSIITGTAGDDNLLDDGADNDYIISDAGNDTITFGSGNDIAIDSSGNDTFIFGLNDGMDTISDLGGIDKVQFDSDLILDNFVFSKQNNNLNINCNANDQIVLKDWFISDNNKIEFLKYNNKDGSLKVGDTLSNNLSGSSNDDILVGLEGNDTLDGQAGIDTLIGGIGNDTYLVDNSDDVIIEQSDNGLDYVKSSTFYTIQSNVENLTLTGTDNINGIGNISNNTIIGNSGNNILDGKEGIDTLIGNGGNDTYIFNAGYGQDIIQDNGGIDKVTFGAGITPDNISFTRNNNDLVIDITGCDDKITVKSWYLSELNKIEALEFADGSSLTKDEIDAQAPQYTGATITGTTGNDTLNSDPGNDTLIGKAGNDTYNVNNSGDIIIENLPEGYDKVISSASYTLSDNVEFLKLLEGNNVINASGNDLNNTIYGNTGNNIISGGKGVDKLYGLEGDDIYLFNRRDAQDTILDTSGTDKIVFGSDISQSDISFLRIGNNIVITIANSQDYLTIENWAFSEANRIEKFEFSDEQIITSDYIDNLGYNISYGTGNDYITGSLGNDTVTGGQGIDTMQGKTGNDIYYVDNSSDSIIEDVEGGTDLVYSVISYTLSANVENVSLTGASAINITGNGLDNLINGNTGANSLSGGKGDDTLSGNLGNDTLIGGNDSDLYLFNNEDGQDLIQDNNGTNILRFGQDITKDNIVFSRNIDSLIISIKNSDDKVTIKNWFSDNNSRLDRIEFYDNSNINQDYINNLGLTVFGSEKSESIIGGSGDDSISGLAGTDTLIGDNGDDVYIIDNSNDMIIEDIGKGQDVVNAWANYTLSGNVEELLLFGSALNAKGNGLDNYIFGNASNNALYGLAGNDTIDGGIGADSMYGGLGNDTFIVDSNDDYTYEDANTDIDSVISSISYTLLENIENLKLSGTSDLIGSGNNLGNSITGNDGINTLDGGLGIDTLSGKLGDDSYYIDNSDDFIIELANSGIDIAYSKVNYSLSENVEKLTLIDSGNINGDGNDIDNSICGNSGNNILNGHGGNDSLDGAQGIDTLIGGTGNDIYYVDNSADTIIEEANSDADIVYSSTNYSISDNLEKLILLGSDSITAFGNNLDNIITGNDGCNSLYGGGGNDTIDGKSGIDSMYGGTGNDSYFVDDVNDFIFEEENSGIDTINSYINYSLSGNVEKIILLGSNNITGEGNDLENNLVGNSGNNILWGYNGDDTLDGGLGIDTLSGGAGNDSYYIDNTSDFIRELECDGDGDIVYSNISYTLIDQLENLTLVGTAQTNAVGNSLYNILTGNNNSNVIDGGLGSDTMIGNSGSDTYYVDDSYDFIIEKLDDGYDTVNSSVNYTLSANVEKLVITGSALNGTGSDMANTILGNANNNIIVGNAGDDFIKGGLGSDTLLGGEDSDTYIFYPGDGFDLINDSGGNNDAVKFGPGASQSTISIFLDDSDNLVIDYGNIIGNDQITIQAQSINSIEKLQLNNAFYLSNIDINEIINYIVSYDEQHTELSITNIEDVRANQDLMTYISSKWHI